MSYLEKKGLRLLMKNTNQDTSKDLGWLKKRMSNNIDFINRLRERSMTRIGVFEIELKRGGLS